MKKHVKELVPPLTKKTTLFVLELIDSNIGEGENFGAVMNLIISVYISSLSSALLSVTQDDKEEHERANEFIDRLKKFMQTLTV